MTTVSDRYVIPLLVLLAPALFVLWSYSYGGFRSDECADPSALLETWWIEGLKSQAGPDRGPRSWLLSALEGSVATKAPRISPLEFQLLRSFEPEGLYGDPVKLLPRSREFASAQPTLDWVEAGGAALPVYKVVAEEPGRTRLGAYMFLYDSQLAEDPALALLSAALRRIATGPRPLTLVTVSVHSASPLRDAAEKLADEWLLAAWEYYQSVCRE